MNNKKSSIYLTEILKIKKELEEIKEKDISYLWEQDIKVRKQANMAKIGIADTTFARIDMAKFVVDVIKKSSDAEIERYTVPGFKDLPVACKKLFEQYKCSIVIALGMAGPKPIDKQCSHEASLGLQAVQLMTSKHILEVFVHMDEAKKEKELYEIAKNRAEKHALNALALLRSKTELTKYAGTGRRQGKGDEGGIRV